MEAGNSCLTGVSSRSTWSGQIGTRKESPVGPRTRPSVSDDLKARTVSKSRLQLDEPKQDSFDDFVAQLTQLLRRKSDRRLFSKAAQSFQSSWQKEFEPCLAIDGDSPRGIVKEAAHYIRIDDDVNCLFDVLLSAVACRVSGVSMELSVLRKPSWASRLQSLHGIPVVSESSTEFSTRVSFQPAATVRYLSSHYSQCASLRETGHRVITLRCQMNGRHELPWYVRKVEQPAATP